ncbi:hypothetical protein HOO69_20240 [Vibrio europaeus]|uniref:Uncharacterized protein n=1 Tax=Vibrio europaeus TaxID=300876 RepID=A0AAE7DYS3_9VIBR|nr:hypothetical protein [Vibrio europaeus]QJY38889.1 hypothetical protein HOO69_20240 [Vibrio europaeus]
MKELIALTLIERLSSGLLLSLKMSGASNLGANSAGLLCFEVRPAHETDTLLDKIFKYCQVELIQKQMDGRSGWVVLTAAENSQLRAAAELVSSETNASEQSIQVTSSSVVSSLSQEHAQQINRQLRRALVSRGRGLLTIDCRPATHALTIANEAEKSMSCQILQLKYLGSSGRVLLTGSADALQYWTAPNMEVSCNR